MVFPDRRLYLLFTPAACAAEPWATLRSALRGGVDLVQWRVQQPDRAGLERCQRLCRDAGVPLLVNDDVMLAVRVAADGAHVGQGDMAAGGARRLLGSAWLGVSTHDQQQLADAIADGADYVGFGPCFPTATKGYTAGKSHDEIAAAVRASTVPLFAIGGIAADNLPTLLGLGVQRIAASAAILQATDPAAAAAALRQQLARSPASE
ncbi:MAG TPA: thiamine phosphate synthase [Planctomycetota bacterium]|nr:thiamine phosphate synthase [Planctomycetota bacterium]